MLKKGRVLEHNKQYVEASNFYFEALNRKNSNVDASIALNRVGNKVLNQYLNDFYKKESIGDIKSAVYGYLKAFNYQKKLNKYKIYNDIPNHYLEKYENVKRIYLKNLYEVGESLMNELSYKNAENSFTEILKFDS